MLKPIILGLIIVLSTAKIIAQYEYRGAEYFNHDEEVTLYLEADKVSRKDKEKEKYIYRYLKVNMNTETGLTEMLRVELGTGENEKQSYKFGSDFLSYTKKYIVLQGFSSFYIFDIRNQKLSPEFTPEFYGTKNDSLSGSLNDIVVSADGTYLYGTHQDGSGFFYSVCDIFKPQEHTPANNPIFSMSRLFIIDNCEMPELKTAYYIARYDDETIFKILLENQKLTDYPGTRTDYTEEEIEEIIINADLSTQRYSILKSENGKYTVIDLFVGRVHKLPEDKSFADKDELRNFLKEQDALRKQNEMNEDGLNNVLPDSTKTKPEK